MVPVVVWMLSLMASLPFYATYVTIVVDSVAIDHRPFRARSETTQFDKSGYQESRVIRTGGSSGLLRSLPLFRTGITREGLACGFGHVVGPRDV